MANYRAKASGNWNNLGTWQDDSSGAYADSTALPGVNDLVYANSFRVTLNVDVTVLKLRNYADINIANGGDFYIVNSSRTITADIEGGTVSPITIYQDLVATRNITINGNISCTSSTAAGIRISGNGSGRNINIKIVGNASGRVVLIEDNITLISLELIGIFTAGTYACFPSPTTSFKAVGILTASATNSVCVGTTTCVANISGVLINVNSRMAVVFNLMYLSPTTSLAWKFYNSDNTEKGLYTLDAFNINEADYRKDATFGFANEFTGTLAVAPPSLVVKDVPTDNTVGTWAFDSGLIARLENVATTDEVGNIVSSYNV